MGKCHYWKVTASNQFDKDFRKLESSEKKRIFDSVRELAEAENPLSVPGVKSLYVDYPGCHRQRVGKFRVVFELLTGEKVEVELCEHQKGVLNIERVLARKDGYRR
jgi:mRNA-degrading endonuclease RelE of RelBE toxin-antitoxin system